MARVALKRYPVGAQIIADRLHLCEELIEVWLEEADIGLIAACGLRLTGPAVI